jgi:hypothetical protein
LAEVERLFDEADKAFGRLGESLQGSRKVGSRRRFGRLAREEKQFASLRILLVAMY